MVTMMPLLIAVYDQSLGVQCTTDRKVTIADQQGFILPPIPYSDVGKPNCPFDIQLDVSQKVRFTLLDFRTQDKVHCPLQLVVDDGAGPQERTEMCQRQGRTRELMTTKGNKVQVYFISTALEYPAEHTVLLQYEGSCLFQSIIIQCAWGVHPSY
jgi:hypothetical protein